MSVVNSMVLPARSQDAAAEALNDDELMGLVAAGQTQAFEWLVRRHQRSVRNVCSRLCGNAALGDDLAQDVFVSLWQLRRRYEARGRFKSYLYTIAVSRCKNLQRSTRRASVLTQRLEDLTPWQDQSDASRLAQQRQLLNECVAKLPLDQREAIALKFGADLDYAQIAQIVACPAATARSRVFLGIAHLRKLFRKWGQP